MLVPKTNAGSLTKSNCNTKKRSNRVLGASTEVKGKYTNVRSFASRTEELEPLLFKEAFDFVGV